MNEKENAIIAENIVKKFGNFQALKGVNLSVKKGELFGLLGPNGAGKTTLLSILSTTMCETSGNAKVAGIQVCRQASQNDEVRKKIGMVFQNPSLDIELTARENLWFHCKMYCIPKNQVEKKIQEALEFSGLQEFAGKQVKKFSGGMKRRLEIARGLMHEPEIPFLDEPTLGLDPQTRRKLWEKIKELNEKGMTIILTTHYMEEADALCERIAIMDKGKIIALGTGRELKNVIKGDTITLQTSNNKIFETKKPIFVKEVKLHGQEVSLTVENAEKQIEKIVLFARKNKAKIESITIKKPSLEEVFLHFTGSWDWLFTRLFLE